MFAISCDWGTTTFRIRLLRDGPGAGPRVLAERTSASGIAAFAPRAEGEYRAFLAVEIPALFAAAGTAPQHAPVILSGMITSSLGWKQPPYAQLPFPLDGSAAVIERDRLETGHGTHELVFVSGVRGADEVMRGEECELIGLYGQPESVPFRDSSVAILPGTHSKTLEIGAGRVNTFRTFLTGELFDVLCRHSILRHSVGSGGASSGRRWPGRKRRPPRPARRSGPLRRSAPPRRRRVGAGVADKTGQVTPQYIHQDRLSLVIKVMTSGEFGCSCPPRPDDQGGAQGRQLRLAGSQHLAYFFAAQQVLGQRIMVVAQATQIDDALHALLARRSDEVLRAQPIAFCKRQPGAARILAHRMDEVVGDVDTVQRAGQRSPIEHIALHYFHAGQRRIACGITGECSHLGALRQQFWDQP